jgi:NarL family two-component system response regulator YdfI
VKLERCNVRYNKQYEVELIRISIIAPAIAVRAGLRALLSDDPNMDIVGEATNPSEMVDMQSEADVIVWSPGASSDLAAVLSELSRLKIDETEALLLVHDDPQVIERLTNLQVRAWGVLDPESTQAELIAGIQALNEGLSVINPLWLKQAIKYSTSSKNGNVDLVDPLTSREIEILQLLALGLTNKQIAARLKISAHTVKFHVSAIFSKLGTNNRVEAVNLGLKNGLIVL